MSPEEMQAMAHTQPQELIEGVLPSGDVAVLAGVPGLGKSFVALSWAAAIAEGSDWFGHATRQAPVVYVLGEGWRTFGRRIVAWEKVNGRPMPESLWFVDGQDFGLDLKDEATVQQLIDTLAHVQPGLVIFDALSTLSTIHNENDNAEAAQVIRNVDRIVHATGATAVLIHYVTKTKRSVRVRGAGVLEGSTDTVIIADYDMNTVGSDRNFALTTDKELGGKRRDGTPTTLHGFYVASPGVLDRANK